MLCCVMFFCYVIVYYIRLYCVMLLCYIILHCIMLCYVVILYYYVFESGCAKCAEYSELTYLYALVSSYNQSSVHCHESFKNKYTSV